jgi:hypothetical protein
LNLENHVFKCLKEQDKMTTRLDYIKKVARNFIKLGWKIVPIKKGEKFPRIKQWQNLNITIKQVDEYFQNDITNIGVLTGPDIFVLDLDMNPWGDLDWKGETKYPWGDKEWEELSGPQQEKHQEHNLIYKYEQKYGDTRITNIIFFSVMGRFFLAFFP